MPLAVQDLPVFSTPSLMSHSSSISDQTQNLSTRVALAEVESSDDEDDSMEYCADGDDTDTSPKEETITKPIQTVDSKTTQNVVSSNETTTARSRKTVNGNKNVSVSEEGSHIVTDKEDYYDDLCLAIAKEIESPEKVPSKDAVQADGAMKKVTFAEKEIEPVNNNVATKKMVESEDTTENGDVVQENSKPVENVGKPDGPVEVVGAKRIRSSDVVEADETCSPAKKQVRYM